MSADAVAGRLYRYGRRPVSPRWRARLADEAAVDRFCGLDANGRAARALRTRWTEAGDRPFWRTWVARGRVQHGNGPVHKLYLEPRRRSGGRGADGRGRRRPGGDRAEVGRGLEGILRPDKIVIYFAGLDELHASGRARARAPRRLPVWRRPVHRRHRVLIGRRFGACSILPLVRAGTRAGAARLAQRLADELVAARGTATEPWRAGRVPARCSPVRRRHGHGPAGSDVDDAAMSVTDPIVLPADVVLVRRSGSSVRRPLAEGRPWPRRRRSHPPAEPHAVEHRRRADGRRRAAFASRARFVGSLSSD